MKLVTRLVKEALCRNPTLTPPGYFTQLQWIIDHTDDMDILEPRYWFNVCWTEALATAAIHPDTYIFTKDDEEPKYNSVWVNVEYPALTLNKNIKRIYRVDPRTPEQRGLDPKDCEQPEAKLIWDRERGDAEITGGLKCPVR